MILSPNFTLEELIFSQIAKRLGIANEPNDLQIECLRQLCLQILQPVRDYFNLPVSITSGFRSPELNSVNSGAANSQHMLGRAADIHISGIGNDILWQYIKDNLSFDQLILEHVPASNPQLGWVHVSFAPVLRREALSCIRPNKYVPGLQYV